MLRALALAKKGMATVSPNPMVGAVLVKDSEIIGEGYHKKKGGPHAEVEAISSAKGSVEGSTLYCTLEPCCHTDKLTPPCADLIIKSKISRVVIGSLDPNPKVSGGGVKKLQEAGIEIISGVLQKNCEELNVIFFKAMAQSRPYVHLKVASTIDGRVASKTGSSKWITSEEARSEVHQYRCKYDAVMIGKNTLLADNPKLTARNGDNVVKEPFKIVVGNLSAKELDLQLFQKPDKVINIYSKSELAELKSLKKKETWDETFKDLYKMGITSILVEGGPVLISSLLEEEAFDRLTVYMAPKIMGNGKSIYESEKILDMENVARLNGHWRLLKSGEAVFEVGA
jgi:diaminohydroxyphosphoribosylaminopyrimidine deaminase/5-amino-6-(5-phosphoribosylamino)uracil reductase